MSTTVVNKHHGVPYDVDIQRPGKWGNLWIVGVHGERGECVQMHRAWITSDQPSAVAMRAQLHELKGKTLACTCKPLPCHGDILAELAELT